MAGIAGVVIVFVAVLSIGEGFKAVMTDAGAPDRAIVMRSGADSEMTSGLGGPEADIIKQAFDKYGDKFVSESGFQCMIDILLKLRANNTIIGEIPFVLRYDYKVGKSKLPVFKTVADTLKLLFRRRFCHD